MSRYSIAVMGSSLWDGKGRVISGGSKVTYELTKRLTKYFDCDMIFETSDKKKINENYHTEIGFTKRFIPRSKELWHLSRDFLERYDLIHIWGSLPIFTYRAYFKDFFVPHCYTLHSAISMRDWMILASAFYVEGYDMIALGSKCLAKSLNRFWNVPVNVIPYGVDTKIFQPLDKVSCRERLGIPKNRFILGYLGRPSKLDFLMAYKVFKRVKKASRKSDLMLLVAGGVNKTKSKWVTDDFMYLGYVDTVDAPFMLNSCDVFFNPVASVQEGFGLTIIEAMACGIPIISTFWNGYVETIKKGCGFLAKTCLWDGDIWINVEDLVSACVRLIMDESLREEFGKKARRLVEEKYKWDYCVDQYRQKFVDIICKGTPESIPYEKAPEKIRICLNGKPQFCSLKEAFTKIEEFRPSFEELYSNFTSSKKIHEKGWRKFMSKDNILNLPKYRWRMKKTLNEYEEKVRRRFHNFNNINI